MDSLHEIKGLLTHSLVDLTSEPGSLREENHQGFRLFTSQQGRLLSV